ncbi:hypothetical protein GCM10010517_35950 [Streptosporangium fragile]|uniref:Uncharacterized protein n=1 Tax=Streptosporangium fragile TaxID=46186 RepID=A0ABP6IHB2_9ACTN
MRERTIVVTHEELARRVVDRLAPDESAAFDLLARPYLNGSTGTRPGRRGRGGDGPLGIGLEEISGALTPAIVLVCGWFVTAVAEGAASEAGGRLTRSVLERLRRRPPAVEAPAEGFDPARLAEIRTSVLAKAEVLGLSQAEAALLADAVVGELTLLAAERQPPRS